MQSQLVFQEEKERERLRRQNLLLSQAEKPALEHFFKGKSELSVLDIGCNDGTRTFHRFSDDRISRVIGLEYNQQLVERANSQFGNTKFSFYQMDVDRDSFSADLQKLCAGFPLPKANSSKKKIFSRPFFPICPRMWKSCWRKNRITENIRTGRTG